MKALTLTQPWATLVAIGTKRFETRSWSTDYVGPIAIHAAKTGLDLPAEIGGWTATTVDDEWRLFAPEPHSEEWVPIPLGAVVATARLVAVRRITQRFGTWTWIDGYGVAPEEELPFGDYSVGRYVWILHDVVPLQVPIPAKGRQGLWEWDGVGVPA